MGKAKTNDNEILRRIKISETMKRNGNSGGYRKGSGRGKSGWYKEYWCDSSYELAYVIYCLDHKMNIERNKKCFEYEWQGETHKYYPDFIVDGKYIEIKGYETKQTKIKYLAVDKPLLVLRERDLMNVFEYVKNKYGSNFLYLYYNFNHVKFCKSCNAVLYKINISGYCCRCVGKYYKSPTIRKVREKRKHYCECGIEIKKCKTMMCRNCYNKKYNIPKITASIEILKEMVLNVGYCATGRYFGVSDNTIRKKIKNGSDPAG